jgi:hypothetical protein
MINKLKKIFTKQEKPKVYCSECINFYKEFQGITRDKCKMKSHYIEKATYAYKEKIVEYEVIPAMHNRNNDCESYKAK